MPRLVASMPISVASISESDYESNSEIESDTNSSTLKLELSSIKPSAISAKLLTIPSQEYLNIQSKNQGYLSTTNLIRIGLLSLVIIIAIFIYFNINKGVNNNNI